MTSIRAILIGLALGLPVGIACAPERIESGTRGCELRVRLSPETLEAGEAAISRINRATGCEVEAADDGVPVSLKNEVIGSEGEPVCGITTIGRWKDGTVERVRSIDVTDGNPHCNSLETLLVHELIHAMIAGTEEHAASGVFHAVSGNGESLNEDSLVTLCSHIACPSFLPES